MPVRQPRLGIGTKTVAEHIRWPLVFLATGKEYVFVSNVDNLGADVDLKILKHLQDSQAEFLMELTDKVRLSLRGFRVGMLN